MKERNKKSSVSDVDIWEAALRHARETPDGSWIPSDASDRHVVVAGPSGSGKTTLCHRYLHPSKDVNVKSTIGVEYSYARKSGSLPGEKRVMHLLDTGGGGAGAKVMQEVFSEKSISRTSLCLVFDASKMGSLLEDVLFWVDTARGAIARLTAASSRTSETASDHDSRSADSVANPALSRQEQTQEIGIPTLIIVNKMDTVSEGEVYVFSC